MLVAAIDSASLTLSCALCELRGGEVRTLAERSEHAPARPGPGGPTGGHGARLPGALAELLLSVDRSLPEVEGYAVGLGPGSFTGLRIGLATWKGLAYANRRPIAGASSLAAMALGAAEHAEAGALLVPLLDAKKGELYAGFYRLAPAGVEAVLPDAALSPAALRAKVEELQGMGERPELFGEGLAAHAAALSGLRALHGSASPRAPGAPAVTPLAAAVGRLCARALGGAAYDAAHLFTLEPHYVRLSEAEVKFPNGTGPGTGSGTTR